MKAIAQGTTYKSIKKKNLELLDLPYPSDREQKEIAKILRLFDGKIRKEVAYKKRLQHLKKGLMQDLLTGKVRTTNTDIDVSEVVADFKGDTNDAR